MLHRFSQRSRDYRVVVDEVREETRLTFRSQREAVAFLRRESRGPEAMRGIRRVLEGARSGIDVGRLSDEEVLLRLGWLVAQGRVRLHLGDHREFGFQQGEVEDEPSAIGPVEGFGIVGDAIIHGPPLFETELASKEPPLVEVGLSVEPADGEENDAETLDAAAQAATLRDAAVDGAPFCEECERLRKEQAAEEAAPDEENEAESLDAPAQAAALRSAAADGAPFCEECERLKQQEAADAAGGGAAA